MIYAFFCVKLQPQKLRLCKIFDKYLPCFWILPISTTHRNLVLTHDSNFLKLRGKNPFSTSLTLGANKKTKFTGHHCKIFPILIGIPDLCILCQLHPNIYPHLPSTQYILAGLNFLYLINFHPILVAYIQPLESPFSNSYFANETRKYMYFSTTKIGNNNKR